MPAWLVPLAISGISALSGLLANRGRKAQESQDQNIDSVTTPDYDPKMLSMRNLLMDEYLNRLQGNEDFFQGYTNEGLKQINQGSDITSRMIENILSARGLTGTSAGGTSEIMNQINRGNQMSSFLNSIPLLRDQRSQQNLLSTGQFFSSLPYAKRTQETRTGTGTQEQAGNPWGGAIGGLGNALGYFYGQGAFDPKPKTNINL